jgi:hypothetical protein
VSIDRPEEFAHQHRGDRAAEARREVPGEAFAVGGATPHSQRGRLQAAEGKVVAAVREGKGERDLLGVAALRKPIHRRPSWIAQPHHPSHLVEGLTRRIVTGATEHRIPALLAHEHEIGVRAGDDQDHCGERPRCPIQPVPVDVSLQMIHAHQRQAARIGQRLGGGYAHGEAPHQPRAARDGDGTDVLEPG